MIAPSASVRNGPPAIGVVVPWRNSVTSAPATGELVALSVDDVEVERAALDLEHVRVDRARLGVLDLVQPLPGRQLRCRPRRCRRRNRSSST